MLNSKQTSQVKRWGIPFNLEGRGACIRYDLNLDFQSVRESFEICKGDCVDGGRVSAGQEILSVEFGMRRFVGMIFMAVIIMPMVVVPVFIMAMLVLVIGFGLKTCGRLHNATARCGGQHKQVHRAGKCRDSVIDFRAVFGTFRSVFKPHDIRTGCVEFHSDLLAFESNIKLANTMLMCAKLPLVFCGGGGGCDC